MNARTIALAALIASLVVGRPAAASDDAAAIKDLYAAASYEEALTQLSRHEEALAPDFTEQYRALCLLALGRSPEAERALERLVAAKPLMTLDGNEAPPKLVSMHHGVRRRQLPDLARSLYVRGKANFEAKNYLVASSELRTLMAILDDEDMTERAGSFADLKVLAEGFLKLTNAELATATKVAVAAAPPPPPPPAPPAPANGIYSDADTGVTYPVEIARRMPSWRPQTSVGGAGEHRGVLEIVIDQRGNVETARVVEPTTPLYDRELLQAAASWRFQPATKDGQPVKFRKTLRIVLSGQ
jgi:TonB family protein